MLTIDSAFPALRFVDDAVYRIFSDLFGVNTCNIVHHLRAGKADSIDSLITRAGHDSRGID
jgi:hypothetical protein